MARQVFTFIEPRRQPLARAVDVVSGVAEPEDGGEQVFRDVGCATCHTPRIVTAQFLALDPARQTLLFGFLESL